MEETLPAAGLEPDMAAVAKTKAQATEHQVCHLPELMIQVALIVIVDLMLMFSFVF